MSKGIQLKLNNEKYYPHPYFPVGSIYLSINNTNPTTWFGGTWELIAKGRTLVGVDPNDADFNTVSKTGGSKHLQAHIHTIEQSAGSRVVLAYNGGGTYNKVGLLYNWTTYADNGNDIYTGNANVTTGNSGNLQPYYTCYIWCRTA